MKTLQKTKQLLVKNKGTIALGCTGMLASVDASAWTAPATTALFYDVYDMVINDFLKGAPGYVAGGALIVGGIFKAAKADYAVGIPLGVGGGLLATAPTLITSLGISVGML